MPTSDIIENDRDSLEFKRFNELIIEVINIRFLILKNALSKGVNISLDEFDPITFYVDLGNLEGGCIVDLNLKPSSTNNAFYLNSREEFFSYLDKVPGISICDYTDYDFYDYEEMKEYYSVHIDSNRCFGKDEHLIVKIPFMDAIEYVYGFLQEEAHLDNYQNLRHENYYQKLEDLKKMERINKEKAKLMDDNDLVYLDFLKFIRDHLLNAIKEKQRFLKDNPNKSTRLVISIEGKNNGLSKPVICYGEKKSYIDADVFKYRMSDEMKEYFANIPGLITCDYTRHDALEIVLEIELQNAIDYCYGILQEEEHLNNSKSYQKGLKNNH